MYTEEISRAKPACFVFLVDQSASMSDAMGGSEGRELKKDNVAKALNRLLYELTLRCAKDEGVRDYFFVAVIGYGQSVGSVLPTSTSESALSPISAIADTTLRIDAVTKKVPDGAGGLVETTIEMPVWVDAVAANGTPMVAALEQAESIVQAWLLEHPDSFPPIVINLTDGEANDGDPTAVADRIRLLASADGSTLLFNLHVSGDQSAPISFPNSEELLANQYARQLFNMSSELPPAMQEAASIQGISVAQGSRGFVFNADGTILVQFLEIGTRTSELR